MRQSTHRWIAALSLVVAVATVVGPRGARAELRVELITLGPGDALWNAYGHTALRVIDTEVGSDRIYNYGVANFTDPAFLWGFLRGRSKYRLAVFPWWETLFWAVEEDRTLYRQPLNLSRHQARELVDFLEWNSRPENAEYFYDHLLDNCSTRVRDVLDRVTRGALSRAVAGWELDRTYRPYTLAPYAGRLHFLLGLDLASGPNQSVVVDGWALMYLPEYLMRGVGAAIVDEGQGLPLAQPAIVVYTRAGPPVAHGSIWMGRWAVVGSAALLGLLFWLSGRSGGRRERGGWRLGLARRVAGGLLALTGLVFGLLGSLYLVLGIISVVPDTHWNENTWLFWPLDLALALPGLRALLLGRWRFGGRLRSYLTWRILLLVGYALLKPTGLFPQDNWAFLVAVVLVLAGLRLGGGHESSSSPHPSI